MSVLGFGVWWFREGGAGLGTDVLSSAWWGRSVNVGG